MPPTISVIIPAFNHDRYVEAALQSVTSQTLQDFEIIVVDDGSTDKTGHLCQQCSARDSRILYFYQENQGAHQALNKGICLASGKFIAVLNSDDLFLPHKLERCLNLVNEHPDNPDLIFGRFEFIDKSGQILSAGIEIDWLSRALNFLEDSNNLSLSLLNENFAATTSNFFFRKTLWEKNRGFQNLRYCHDLDFLIASFQNGSVLFDKDFSHIHYRVHPTNTIKEDYSHVLVEVGAVLSVAFFRLFSNRSSPHPIEACAFKKLLANKNISPLIVFLMSEFLRTKRRDLFYSLFRDPSFLSDCKSFLA